MAIEKELDRLKVALETLNRSAFRIADMQKISQATRLMEVQATNRDLTEIEEKLERTFKHFQDHPTIVPEP